MVPLAMTICFLFCHPNFKYFYENVLIYDDNDITWIRFKKMTVIRTVVVRGLIGRAGICFVVERKLLPSLT